MACVSVGESRDSGGQTCRTHGHLFSGGETKGVPQRAGPGEAGFSSRDIDAFTAGDRWSLNV